MCGHQISQPGYVDDNLVYLILNSQNIVELKTMHLVSCLRYSVQHVLCELSNFNVFADNRYTVPGKCIVQKLDTLVFVQLLECSVCKIVQIKLLQKSMKWYAAASLHSRIRLNVYVVVLFQAGDWV